MKRLVGWEQGPKFTFGSKACKRGKEIKPDAQLLSLGLYLALVAMLWLNNLLQLIFRFT
jgi:hypothetical protein